MLIGRIVQGALPAAWTAADRRLVRKQKLWIYKTQCQEIDTWNVMLIVFPSTAGRGENGKGAISSFPGAGKERNGKQKPVADTAMLRTAPTNSFDTMQMNNVEDWRRTQNKRHAKEAWQSDMNAEGK